MATWYTFQITIDGAGRALLLDVMDNSAPLVSVDVVAAVRAPSGLLVAVADVVVEDI